MPLNFLAATETVLDSILSRVHHSACREKDSWLDIQLFCTGTSTGTGQDTPVKPPVNGSHTNGNHMVGNGKHTNADLSLGSGTKDNNEQYPPVQRPELKLTSPFFLKPRYCCPCKAVLSAIS